MISYQVSTDRQSMRVGAESLRPRGPLAISSRRTNSVEDPLVVHETMPDMAEETARLCYNTLQDPDMQELPSFKIRPGQ